MEIKISICRDGNDSVLKEFIDKKTAIDYLNNTLPETEPADIDDVLEEIDESDDAIEIDEENNLTDLESEQAVDGEKKE